MLWTQTARDKSGIKHLNDLHFQETLPVNEIFTEVSDKIFSCLAYQTLFTDRSRFCPRQSLTPFSFARLHQNNRNLLLYYGITLHIPSKPISCTDGSLSASSYHIAWNVAKDADDFYTSHDQSRVTDRHCTSLTHHPLSRAFAPNVLPRCEKKENQIGMTAFDTFLNRLVPFQSHTCFKGAGLARQDPIHWCPSPSLSVQTIY